MNYLIVAILVLVIVGIGYALYFLKGNMDAQERFQSRTMNAAPPARASQSSLNAAPSPVPTTPANGEHWLLGMDGVVAEKNFFVGNKTITIGRDFNNYIQVVGEDISRQHAHLYLENGKLKIVDMHSQIGVLVNKEKVEFAFLEDNDIITIGEASFLYKREGNYGENSGLERKNVRPEVTDETLAGNDLDMKNLISMAVKENNGDLEAAAKMLRISLEKLKKIQNG